MSAVDLGREGTVERVIESKEALEIIAGGGLGLGRDQEARGGG